MPGQHTSEVLTQVGLSSEKVVIPTEGTYGPPRCPRENRTMSHIDAPGTKASKRLCTIALGVLILVAEPACRQPRRLSVRYSSDASM